jgi:hypothetical protein
MLISTKITRGLPLGAIGSLTCPVADLPEREPLAREEELKCQAVQPTVNDAFRRRDEDLLPGSVATPTLGPLVEVCRPGLSTWGAATVPGHLRDNLICR